MKAAIVIPARYGSTRYPGKPLVEINGKPLIRWTWESACKSGLPVYVATDDQNIADTVIGFGGNAILTIECRNGTERCAIANSALKADFIINWQGGSPLIDHEWPLKLLLHMGAQPVYSCGTIGILTLPHAGMVEVVADNNGCATGFRRRSDDGDNACLMHVGIYGYWASALAEYLVTPERSLEVEKGLEQLRWSHGQMVVKREHAPSWPMREVNLPEDTQLVADVLRKRDETARQ